MNLGRFIRNRWNKQSKGSKLFGAFFLCAIAVFFAYTRVIQLAIPNKDELKFIRGSLAKYNFIDGNRGFHDYTFKLSGYFNPFQISADFLNLFDQEKFQNLQYGDSLTIGISQQDYDQLKASKYEKILVFSITNEATSFLDQNKVLKKYNSFFLYYAAIAFFLAGIAIVYSVYRSKYN